MLLNLIFLYANRVLKQSINTNLGSGIYVIQSLEIIIVAIFFILPFYEKTKSLEATSMAVKILKEIFLFNWYFDCLIGQVVFGIAMKVTYQSASVFLKQIKSYRPYASNIFRKEALVLSQIKHENLIRVLGVCYDPVSLMTEYCCFSLRPSERNEQLNSLDQLLLFLHIEDLFSFFPTIGNSISKDFVSAVLYLHENYIVHQDLKTGNTLVHNSHYNSALDSVEISRVFSMKRQ